MKPLFKLFSFCFLTLLMQCGFATSPVGFWQTIDDTTGKPKAIVEIWETTEHTLNGRIIKFYPGPGYTADSVCSACDGARHNKRISGMTIVENLVMSKDNPNEWSGGTILDPKTGKIYRCYIQVKESGKELNVRGYLGLALFGRTQTWLRTSQPEEQTL